MLAADTPERELIVELDMNGAGKFVTAERPQPPLGAGAVHVR